MNHIKLVLVDIDGTLLNDNGIVTPKTIAAKIKRKTYFIWYCNWTYTLCCQTFD